MKSSLYLVIEEIRKKKKNKTKQKQMLHYETRHVSVMTTAATLKTLLNKIMIAIFNHWEFFVSGETEIWLFFFQSLQPFYFSRSRHPTESSLPFRACIHFSRDPISFLHSCCGLLKSRKFQANLIRLMSFANKLLSIFPKGRRLTHETII